MTVGANAPLVNGLGHTALSLVVFVIEGRRYGLNLAVVERVFPMAEVTTLAEAPSVALGVINIHGQVIPVLDVRRRFGHHVREYGPDAYLLVARSSTRVMALPVDEVLGVQEIALRDVTLPETIFPGIAQVEGIVTLSDGLLFIHNLDTFLSLEEEQHLIEALEAHVE